MKSPSDKMLPLVATDEGNLIPFNKPGLGGREMEYIQDAIRRWHISGDGWYTKECQRLLQTQLGCGKVLLTTSCTHALEMMALLLNIAAGDEVIVPSYTFVSTANAFALRGAIPVFADIRPDTLNIDETSIEALITSRTKAICVVHYGGVACEMDTILEIGRRHGVPILEDNAHGLFGRYRGRWLGGLGAMATLSFHETKNFVCGEGGALIINDERLFERAEILREKGTDRSRFFRGQVDKYTWVDLGSSFLPSDVLAAFLLAQLEAKDAIIAQRRQVHERYVRGLTDWARKNGVVLPTVPDECDQSYHLFYLLMPTLELRTSLIRYLADHKIQAVFHYLPLNQSPMAQRWGSPKSCPVTEDLSDRLVRLPLFNTLTVADQERIIGVIGQLDLGSLRGA